MLRGNLWKGTSFTKGKGWELMSLPVSDWFNEGNITFHTWACCKDYRSHTRFQIPSISRQAVYHSTLQVHITHCLTLQSTAVHYLSQENHNSWLQYQDGRWQRPEWRGSLILHNVSKYSAGLECVYMFECGCAHFLQNHLVLLTMLGDLQNLCSITGRKKRAEDECDLWKTLLV